MVLYNKLRKNPFYFFQCVVAKKFILVAIYLLSLSVFGYEDNVALFSVLSFFLISPNPKVQLVVLASCMGAAFYLYQLDFMQISLLFALGIYWGGLMSVLIHNTSHEIIKPRLLNRILGEVASFFLTIGFINFLYVHIQHHIHSDKEEDPHHNMQEHGFIDYWASMGRNVTKMFKSYLPEQVCHSNAQYKYLVGSVVLNKLLILHIQLIWFGESGFSFFSIPCIIASQVLFAYINYYTHPNSDQGREIIVDIDSKMRDQIINRLFFGILFHKTHHKHPKAANPMKLRLRKDIQFSIRSRFGINSPGSTISPVTSLRMPE